MSKPILILTVGLPRSGKSTWAKSTGDPVVNRDAIRLALHGRAYIQDAEDMVSTLETYMVKALFMAGHAAVIIDACHLKPKYIQRWESDYWDIKLHRVDTHPDVCIKRAIADGREDLIPIIIRMDEDGKKNPGN